MGAVAGFLKQPLEGSMSVYSLENLDEDEIGSALDRAFAAEGAGSAASDLSGQATELTAENLEAEASAEAGAVWYLGVGDPPVGPLTRPAVRELWTKGEVTADTLCWRTGFEDWKPIWRVKELASVALEERTLHTLSREPVTPTAIRDQLSALAQDEMAQMAREPEPEPQAPVEALEAPPAPEVAPEPAQVATPSWEVDPELLSPPPEETAAPVPPAFIALLGAGAVVALMMFGVIFTLILRPGVPRVVVPAPAPLPATRPVAAAPVPAPVAPVVVAPVAPPPTVAPVVVAPPTVVAPHAVRPVTSHEGSEHPVSAKVPHANAEDAKVEGDEAPKSRPAAASEKKVAVVAHPETADADFEKTFGDGADAPEHPVRPAPVVAAHPAPAAEDLPESISQADVIAVVLAHKAAVSTCVEAQHQRSGSETGATVLRWGILPSGKVTDVAPVSDDAAQAAFAGCLTQQIKKWTFPKHVTQGDPVEFPFRY